MGERKTAPDQDFAIILFTHLSQFKTNNKTRYPNKSYFSFSVEGNIITNTRKTHVREVSRGSISKWFVSFQTAKNTQ